ncbi:endonuclease/exonuclease/phosphatase family protein [Aquipuribacter nitratireducens]|uniref:Endonuclease/exonuclease/phosphatase family protein n=1 Tax=Aquipuribacter nitratireducens TaxID=650104 RepID=A0ABW0GMZ1_9MICO
MTRSRLARGVAVALLVVAAPVTLARLLGSVGLDTVTPSVQLVGLAPLAGAVLLVALAAAVVAPVGRRLVVVLLVAVALHAGWALAPLVADRLGPESDRGDAVVLRLLSVNARFGNAHADEVVALVRDLDVDVLAVQELTAPLAGDLGRAGLAELLPHEVAVRVPGAAGAATFSRWPLTALGAPSTTFTTLVTEVAVPGAAEGVTVVNVHTWPPLPGTVERWRRDHALLRGAVADLPGRVVVAGDLNATRDHSAMRALLRAGDLAEVADGRAWAPTWPADQPFPSVLRLDHVLAGPGVAPTGPATAHRVVGSDHLAVAADLVLDASP